MPDSFVTEFTEHADDAWITANGAQMVVTYTSITTCRTTCASSTSGRASPKITDIAGIKRGYYAIHDVNPTGIVPLGPGDLHLTGPHDRGRLGAAA